MNGTGMSAAYVSGAAALSKSAGVEDLKERLKNTADKLSCLDGKVSGGSKVNFYGAMNNIAAPEGYVEVDPEDDFDVNGYERTPEENWKLFSSLTTVQKETTIFEMKVVVSFSAIIY